MLSRREAQHALRFAVIVAGLVLLAGAARAQSEGMEATSRPRASMKKPVSFTPDVFERCDYFFVTEFSTSYVHVRNVANADNYIFTDSFGLMRNVDPRSALGASVDVLVAQEKVKVAPTLRYKRWLTGRQSADLTLGYAIGGAEGPVGPLAGARYSPVPWFNVQAGVCRYRDVRVLSGYPILEIKDEKKLRVHAGVGLGGFVGLASWGAQAIVGGVVLAIVSRMD